jgi:DNA-binding transcriptional ArsR family regulator
MRASLIPPSRTTSRQLDERLAKALSHPLRQRILQRLNEGGVKSPNELSRDLGDPLGNVSYHVRILRELDCVELVRTEQRRGALEHYYRATAQPWLDDNQWARLPAAFRRKTHGRTLSEILEAASTASQAGGFDHPEVTLSHVALELDEQGWDDAVKLLNDMLESALRIQAESQKRQGKSGADGESLRTELGILHFRQAAST